MASIGGTFLPSCADIKSALSASAGKDPKSMRTFTLVPIYKELIADLETPVSTYLKLQSFGTSGRGGYSCLLESVEGGERLARYSFVGFNPHTSIAVGDVAGCTHSGDPLAHVQSFMDREIILPVASSKLPTFSGGAIGYVAYDAVRHFEPRTAAALGRQTDTFGIPEAIFMFCNNLVVFDHVRHTIKVVAHVDLRAAGEGGGCGTDSGAAALATAYAVASAQIQEICRHLMLPLGSTAVPCDAPLDPVPASITPLTFSPTKATGTGNGTDPGEDFEWEAASNVGRVAYEAGVRHLQHHMTEGDIIQAVPSHRVGRPLPPTATAFDIYRQLRVINPSPYMFYLDFGPDFQIVGASPEMLVKVDTDGTIFTHPIAGTRRRGLTPEEDDALAAELLADEKERAEHVMLVDLGRNDIGRVAAPGTVHVDSLMHIERYSHVMHIVSNVSGKLAVGKTAFDAFRSIFPAGTVSGAPKVRAVELVAELEKERRHVYAGSVGYVGYSGIMDTAIAIRTIVVRHRVAYLQAGAGIVYDSVPASEYEETLAKMRGVMRAVEAVTGTAACMPILKR